MKRKRTRTGVSRFLALAAIALVSLPLWSALEKDKKSPTAYALIFGTVFRENGMSLPGADVEIAADASTGGQKFKKQKAVSDARGEFAFRVPPVPAKLKVSVKADGYSPQDKEVAVTAEERIDVFFRLVPASKPMKGKSEK